MTHHGDMDSPSTIAPTLRSDQDLYYDLSSEGFLLAGHFCLGPRRRSYWLECAISFALRHASKDIVCSASASGNVSSEGGLVSVRDTRSVLLVKRESREF